MQNKRLMLLIAVSLLALVSLIYGIVTPSKSRRQDSSHPELVQQAISPSLKDVIPAERTASRSSFVSWGRNPFLPVGRAAQSSAKVYLNGIVWDEKTPRAIINNRILRVGDQIGERKVVVIEKNRVILKEGYQELELRLGQRK